MDGIKREKEKELREESQGREDIERERMLEQFKAMAYQFTIQTIEILCIAYYR